jgi:hypothetical protein
MASFSRGHMMLFKLSSPPTSRMCTQCLRRAQRIRPSPSPISSKQSTRLFSISRVFRDTPKPKLGKLRSQKTTSTTQNLQDGLTDYAARLNLTLTTPTVIYEAPSHRTLSLAACGLSAFFIGYGVLNAWQPGMGFIFGRAPEREGDRISWIIPPILIFVGGALIGIGVWSYGAVRNLVKRITVVPRGLEGDMMAQLQVTKLAPWRRHEIEVPLRSLALGRRVQDIAPETSLADRYKKIEDAHVLIRPFMKAGSWSRTFFDETRNVFWRVPFVTLDTGGKGKFTLDARGAAYKGAVGLDRLIPHNFEKGKFWEALG